MVKTKLTIDYPASWDKALMEAAKKDGHSSRSAIIRKAIAFFLESELQKVASENVENTEAVAK